MSDKTFKIPDELRNAGVEIREQIIYVRQFLEKLLAEDMNDIDEVMILDCMAIAGLKFEKPYEKNIASYAYIGLSIGYEGEVR
jgi:hypothetical protein